jgi:predicted translation initiation factor SUI1
MAARKTKIVLFLGGDPALLTAVEQAFLAITKIMGLPWSTQCGTPETASIVDAADWIVCLDEAAHRPLLQERFPALLDRVEFWPPDPTGIDREVIDLAARLIGGGRRREVVPPAPVAPARKEPVRPAAVVRVGRETKGRRGKGVTIVYDVPEDEAGLLALAAQLKQRCGTGGTVKEGTIEIQGDQRDRLTVELQALGYRVKRIGG